MTKAIETSVARVELSESGKRCAELIGLPSEYEGPLVLRLYQWWLEQVQPAMAARSAIRFKTELYEVDSVVQPPRVMKGQILLKPKVSLFGTVFTNVFELLMNWYLTAILRGSDGPYTRFRCSVSEIAEMENISGALLLHGSIRDEVRDQLDKSQHVPPAVKKATIQLLDLLDGVIAEDDPLLAENGTGTVSYEQQRSRWITILQGLLTQQQALKKCPAMRSPVWKAPGFSSKLDHLLSLTEQKTTELLNLVQAFSSHASPPALQLYVVGCALFEASDLFETAGKECQALAKSATKQAKMPQLLKTLATTQLAMLVSQSNLFVGLYNLIGLEILELSRKARIAEKLYSTDAVTTMRDHFCSLYPSIEEACNALTDNSTDLSRSLLKLRDYWGRAASRLRTEKNVVAQLRILQNDALRSYIYFESILTEYLTNRKTKQLEEKLAVQPQPRNEPIDMLGEALGVDLSELSEGASEMGIGTDIIPTIDATWKPETDDEALDHALALVHKMAISLVYSLCTPIQEWAAQHESEVEGYRNVNRPSLSKPEPTKHPAKGENKSKGKKTKKGRSRRQTQRKASPKLARTSKRPKLLRKKEPQPTIEIPEEVYKAPPPPSETILEKKPEVGVREVRPLEPAKLDHTLNSLLEVIGKIDPAALLDTGTEDDEARTAVRHYARRTLALVGRPLARLLQRGAQRKQPFDYDEAMRVLDSCRRLLEAAFTLAVARYPIEQKDRHVIVAHAEPHSGLPDWGHDLRRPYELLIGSREGLDSTLYAVLVANRRVVYRLTQANRLLHYPGSAQARGYHREGLSGDLHQLLHHLETKEGQEDLVADYLAPTVKLVGCLVDEREVSDAKRCQVDAAVANWMQEQQKLEVQLSMSLVTTEKKRPVETAEMPESTVDSIRVHTLQDALRSTTRARHLITAARFTPAYGDARLGSARQRERNSYLKDVDTHLKSLEANLRRARKRVMSPEDCRQALHEVVRALRATHVAALLHLPLQVGESHLVYTDGGLGDRRLSFVTDIVLLNQLLREANVSEKLSQQLNRVPDLAEMSWLQRAHKYLNNPAYQLPRAKGSALAKTVKSLLKGTKELWTIRDAPEGFSMVVNGELIDPTKARSRLQREVEATRKQYLFPAIEMLHRVLTAGFPPPEVDTSQLLV